MLVVVALFYGLPREQEELTTRAVEAVRELGFNPVVGPFGTTIEGDSDRVIAAVKQLLDAPFCPASTQGLPDPR